MSNRILIITEDYENKNLLLENRDDSDIYYIRKIHDALCRLTVYQYYLVILNNIKDTEKGYKIIETIRALKKIPILVLTRAKVKERVLYVEAGADVVLSTDNKEDIELQMFALMRRYSEWEINNNEKDNIIQNGSLILNFLKRRVFWKGRELKLSKHEFDFLYIMASSPERVYTFDQIYQMIWGDYPQGDISNMIWCLVRRIKKKLKSLDPGIPDMIHSVWDTGYVFRLDTKVEERQVV